MVVLSVLLSFGLLSLLLALRSRRTGPVAAYAALGFAAADLLMIFLALREVRLIVPFTLAVPAFAAILLATFTLRSSKRL
jgi:hypothetical protein